MKISCTVWAEALSQTGPLRAYPVLLAGAESTELRRGAGREAMVSAGAVQFAPSPARHSGCPR